MKEGLKYKEVYPNGDVASNRVIVRITEKSVFSQNTDNPQNQPARESVLSFSRRVKNGIYVL